MAIEINLLPKEVAKSKGVEKSLILLNKLAIAATAIFLIIVVAGAAFYFLMAGRLSRMNEERSTLIANIQGLQSTESSIILLRDRIQKVQNTLSARSSEDLFEKQQSVLAVAPENVLFEESSIESSLSTLEVSVDNSSGLVTLISNLIAQGNYVSLVLEELSFNPFSGYTAEFSVY